LVKIFPKGTFPKKIYSLDGGGVLGPPLSFWGVLKTLTFLGLGGVLINLGSFGDLRLGPHQGIFFGNGTYFLGPRKRKVFIFPRDFNPRVLIWGGAHVIFF